MAVEIVIALCGVLSAGTWLTFRLRLLERRAGVSSTLARVRFGVVASVAFGVYVPLTLYVPFAQATTGSAPPWPPPLIVTEPASSVTQTSAILNAWAFMHGARIEGCAFEYGTSTAYGSSGPCAMPPGTAAILLSVGGLAPATTYHYRPVVTAWNGTNYGVDHSFATLAPPPPPQEAPSNQGGVPLNGSPARAVPDAELARTSLVASSDGRVKLAVTCPPNVETCAGTVTLRMLQSAHGGLGRERPPGHPAAVRVLATGRFSVAGGAMKTLTLRLSRKARSPLARKRLLHAEAILAAHDPVGTMHTATVAIAIRAATTKRR